jgi:hypothetical protein
MAHNLIKKVAKSKEIALLKYIKETKFSNNVRTYSPKAKLIHPIKPKH